jgi:hypothetical protein
LFDGWPLRATVACFLQYDCVDWLVYLEEVFAVALPEALDWGRPEIDPEARISTRHLLQKALLDRR